MEKFDFENYRGFEWVMHCATAQEAREFCKAMTAVGRTWLDGESYENNTLWHIYKEDTCYQFNKGMYADLPSFLEEEDPKYQVLQWKNFDGWIGKKGIKV